MSIKKELDLSKKYLISKTYTSEGLEIVDLTLDNVARIEAMIQNDSDYKKTANPESKPEKYPRKKTDEYKYGGSTAYWITQLKDILIYDKPVSRDVFSFEVIIENAVKTIDRENSTHLNADNNGRNEISLRIINNKENLFDWICYPSKNDYAIIKEISKKTKGEKGRVNLSFASKFAHYTSFYLFEGTEFQDNFSIYDGVLTRALPRYLDAYEIIGYNLNDYVSYQKAIDLLRKKAAERYGEIISRNGLDHLLWYYHK